MRLPTDYEIKQMERETNERCIFGSCIVIILIAISLILIG